MIEPLAKFSTWLNSRFGLSIEQLAAQFSSANGSEGPPGPEGPPGTAGVDGVDGSTWRHGAGAPNNALGIDGDYYLDTNSGDVYSKSAGAYSLAGNIKGPTGAEGPEGPPGADGQGSGGLPAGAIILWSGLLENIPAGFALCDGTNGTPDLRGRFVKGAAADVDPGATGGAATHTHADHAPLAHAGAAVADHLYTPQGSNSAPTFTGNALPSHTHNYTDVPNHVHVQTVNSATTGGSSGYTPDTTTNSGVASGYSTQTNTGGVATGTTQGPSSTLTPAGTVSAPTFTGNQATIGHAVNQPDDHTLSAHEAANHEPSYYELAYLMKL
jgi:hypothetical protein